MILLGNDDVMLDYQQSAYFIEIQARVLGINLIDSSEDSSDDNLLL